MEGAAILSLSSDDGKKVVRLDDRHCRLEGRTWYRVDMWPTSVFRALAEFSIHRVHERVLAHIRSRTESR